ncbi:hypothetical protein C8Q79DRAFT_1014440 [Trametes meyenii]|nr:hypothetical protein C8Q79DRAFT_1014440 [Trametes meyenii]
MRLIRLQTKFDYWIGKSTLKKLNAKFKIPSARKPPPLPLATTVVVGKMTQDINRRNGPNEVTKQIASEGKYIIPRDVVRAIMRDNDPLGFELRYRAHRPRIERGSLMAKGVNHEHSVDGHEKLGSLSLRMGPVGFGIYGVREKVSGRAMYMVVVPNARKSSTIGHVYCDNVSFNGFIARQLTADHGSETGEMYAVHSALRRVYSPELDEGEWPPFVAIASTSNISIENLWSRWLKWAGSNCYSILTQGATNGLFNPVDQLDVNLFQWLWSQIIQRKLDEFVQYWNCHLIRSQPGKQLPSGTSPMNIYEACHAFGYQDIRIPVDVEVVEHLRSKLPESREEAFRFVSDEFKAGAEKVYAGLGKPQLALEDGWEIFAQMQAKLRMIM